MKDMEAWSWTCIDVFTSTSYSVHLVLVWFSPLVELIYGWLQKGDITCNKGVGVPPDCKKTLHFCTKTGLN